MTSVKKLDCRGLACPQPVLRVKEALDQGADRLEVVVDNETAVNNIQRFAINHGHAVQAAQIDGGTYRVAINAQTRTQQNVEKTYPASAQGGLVYMISSDCMGRGNDELGWALMQTYVRTIVQIEPLPSAIIFYNSGVKLVAVETGALQALQELESRGVEILACGTCLDFYHLKSAVKVGQISNMFAIMDAAAKAAKVVSPL